MCHDKRAGTGFELADLPGAQQRFCLRGAKHVRGVRKKPRNLNQKRTQTRPKAVGTICPSDMAGREI